MNRPPTPDNDTHLIGMGLYTFAEASRLTGITTVELGRWLRGYPSNKQGEPSYQPLWESELTAEGISAMSFHDLLEVRFVKEFRKLGLSLQVIRAAARTAREVLNSPYPFTCKEFQTDGETIFAGALDAGDDGQLLDLRRRQYVIRRVVHPSLYAGIEFGTDKRAQRWYPMERSRSIVLDPQIAFGKPVVASTSIRTDILYDAWQAEDKDTRRVSRLYEVPVSAVNAALRYERKLAA